MSGLIWLLFGVGAIAFVLTLIVPAIQDLDSLEKYNMTIGEKECYGFCYPDKYFYDKSGWGADTCVCKEERK